MNINFEGFSKEYEVRRNPIRPISPYENTMLDYDDEELDYLEEQDTHRVWSLVEGDVFTLKPGLHYKDVIGYFVCRKEWSDDKLNFTLI